MNSLHKAALTVNGNDLHVSMPFAKINKEKRTVSGWATLDNFDSQGDIVLAEASAKAFKNARGNLREMHQPVAVGKVVDFREDEFYDKKSKEFYRGIFVTARVSKGAQDTWEKVLDGTLTGFSIGGEITDSESNIVKDASGGSEKQVRIIKDYDLVELSLVDNPANQLANVFSIQKAAGGSVKVTGMVADTKIENVFYCEDDVVIQSKVEESAKCPECGEDMKAIGWFENVGNRTEKVKEIVAKHLAADSEGGVEVAKNKEENTPETDESVLTGNERGDETEVPTPAVDATTADQSSDDVDETAGTEEVHKAADVEEVTDDTTEISKKIDSLKEEIKDVVTSSLSKVSDETKESVSNLEKKLELIKDDFSTKVSELDKKLSSYDEKLDATKNRLAGLEKSLEKLNSADALKKSADLGNRTARTQKDETAWNGAFSIDNVL